jgi:replicative DNA helicase
MTGKSNLPPHNEEGEQALLGALLVNPQALAEVKPLLRADDFYIARHGFVYDAILKLDERHEPVDAVTVSDELKAIGQLQDMSAAAVVALINAATSVSAYNAAQYARIVKGTSTRRRLLSLASKAAALAYDDAQSVNEVLDQVDQSLQDLREQQTGHSRMRSMKKIASDLWDLHKAAQEARDKGDGVFKTGFCDLDKLTGGHRPGSLVIIGARPGMGKTALLLNLVEKASQAGRGVLFFSLEMTAEGLGHRMMTSGSEMDLTRLSTFDLSNDDWTMLPVALDKLGKHRVWVDDTPALSLPDMVSRAKRLTARVPISLIAVDYVQLVTTTRRHQNRYNEIGEISAGLKALAKETNTTVLAASQLNRAVEMRHDKRPNLADLRESGNLEQDADTVLLISPPREFGYNDEGDEGNDDPSNGVSLIVAKNRWGKTGEVPLIWQGSRVRFVSAEVEERSLDF